jgi:hypothetical protein
MGLPPGMGADEHAFGLAEGPAVVQRLLERAVPQVDAARAVRGGASTSSSRDAARTTPPSTPSTCWSRPAAGGLAARR